MQWCIRRQAVHGRGFDKNVVGNYLQNDTRRHIPETPESSSKRMWEPPSHLSA